MKNMLKGNSGNSILLAAVKLFTTFSGILSTMIISHSLSLELYGTYSQTSLIVITATNVSALGLVDAVNFFYNRSDDVEQQKKYINTVIGIQCITGILTAVLILIFSSNIVSYFNNVMLKGMFGLIAFRPILANLNVSLQYLQVSIGKAKSVAVRNACFSMVKLIVFSVTAFCFQDIRIILITFLVFEAIITLYFGKTFISSKFVLNPFQIDLKKIKEIFGYSIPMGIYVMTNSLCRDIDKMLIGGWCSTEQYAIYTNCATLLPFDIVSLSFLTILIPILTHYFGNKEYDKGRKLFKNYLKIGYYTSFVFTLACIILSKEMISFLYGDKYLSGQTIFVLYILVDMVKFANMSIVLSACGKTRILMFCSVGSLVLNYILNVIFFNLFGLHGPAYATVIVTIILTVTLAGLSSKALKTNIKEIIDWRDLRKFIFKLTGFSIVCVFIKHVLLKLGLNSFLVLLVVGMLYIGMEFVMNYREIKSVLVEINKLK